MMKILVVDDEPMLLAATSRGLRLHRYDVATAANGEDALKLLAVGFDLVLTDWEMPGIRGDTLCRAIKSRYPKLPVILNSGDVRALALDCGADAVRLKPYSLRDLREDIDRLTGGRSDVGKSI